MGYYCVVLIQCQGDGTNWLMAGMTRHCFLKADEHFPLDCANTSKGPKTNHLEIEEGLCVWVGLGVGRKTKKRLKKQAGFFFFFQLNTRATML